MNCVSKPAVFAAVSALLLLQAPAQGAGKPKKPQADLNAELICKAFPTAPGTRIKERKICKTRAEWDAIDEDIRQVLDAVQRKPYRG